MNEIKNIPIVLSCDENYTVPLCVSLLSLLKKAKETTFYEIYILLEKDFSKESKDKILSLRKKYPNCSITFFLIGSEFDHAYVSLHITKAAYFRLKIASLLPDFSKCLYLDCDILVLKDLTNLFDTELADCVFAGVNDMDITEEDKIKRGLKKTSNYINSGILVMNLDKIRKENLEKHFFTLARNTYQYHDQDIINIACEGKIKLLELKYNLPAFPFYSHGGEVKYAGSVQNYTEAEIDDALRNKLIVHYLGNNKPWQKSEMFYGEVWWMYHEELEKLAAT